MAGVTWEVVGGADRGGILVRAGQDLASAKLPERLSTGARIRQVALEGERLRYERLEGSGPREGWVSVRISDKELLVRVPTDRSRPGQLPSPFPPRLPPTPAFPPRSPERPRSGPAPAEVVVNSRQPAPGCEIATFAMG